MIEHPSNRKPLTPVERLANLCDALWEDELLDTQVEIDEKRVEKARSVVHAAIADALVADVSRESAITLPSSDKVARPFLKALFSEQKKELAEVLNTVGSAIEKDPNQNLRDVFVSGWKAIVEITGQGLRSLSELLPERIATENWNLQPVVTRHRGDSPPVQSPRTRPEDKILQAMRDDGTIVRTSLEASRLLVQVSQYPRGKPVPVIVLVSRHEFAPEIVSIHRFREKDEEAGLYLVAEVELPGAPSEWVVLIG